MRHPAPISRFLLTSALLSTASFTLTTTSAHAQCLNPNIGVATGSGSDVVTLCAPLGFNFPFPDGSTHSAVSCDSNGRIFPVDADGSDFSPTVDELLSQTTALMPLWTDQGGGTFDDVYCASNGVDTATITWVDTRYNFGNTPFTVQAELHADGSFRFVYDERMRDIDFVADPVYIGFTDGGSLSSDPGSSDYSTIVRGNPVDSGTSATGYDNGLFELSGIALDFTPNGFGGYTTTASTCGLAFVAGFGESCQTFPTTASRYTTGLFGASNLTRVTAALDTNPGIPMGHTDDSIRSAVLGFDIRFPDGTLTDTIDVDSNGRILQLGTDSSDFSPSIAEMLAEEAHFNVFWTDLTPTDPDSSVDFFSNGVDLATVTWNNVRQFNSSVRITVQAQMRPATLGVHSFTVVFEDTGNFDPIRDLIVGFAQGNDAADPGENNIDEDVTGFTATIYELFDIDTDVYDLQPQQLSPTIEYLSHPVNGSTFQVQLNGMLPTNLGSFIMLGFNNLNAPLDVLGLPCTLYSDNLLPAVAVGVPGAATATWSLPIMNVGTPLVIQGAIVEPGINSLGLDLTTALQVVTGL